MQQTKIESFIEACINTVVGFGISTVANAIILPLVGLPVSLGQNLLIGLGMTLVSVARQYVLRRWAQKHLTNVKESVVEFFTNLMKRRD